MEEGFIRIAATSEVPEGTMKSFDLAGNKIAVYCIAGEYFATEDTCTHAQCSLAGEGFLDGKSVVCGCHGGTFDIPTGKVLSLPPTEDLRVFSVNTDKDSIYIKI